MHSGFVIESLTGRPSIFCKNASPRLILTFSSEKVSPTTGDGSSIITISNFDKHGALFFHMSQVWGAKYLHTNALKVLLVTCFAEGRPAEIFLTLYR